MKKVSHWHVLVGNVGTVYEGTNGFKAKQEYSECKLASLNKQGRFADEPVTLFRDGDIYWEYTPLDMPLQ